MPSNPSLAEVMPDFQGYIKGMRVFVSRPTDPLVMDIVAPVLPQLPELLTDSSPLVQQYSDCMDRQSVDNPEGSARAIQKLNEDNKEFVSVMRVFARLQDLSEHRLGSEYPPGMAPIYKLPVELLSYVFTFLAEGLPLIEWHKPVMVNVPVIVTLSCVCRLWNEVVQEHTPELWSTVSTTYSPKRLDRVLQSSRGSLLDFHVAFGPKTETTSAYFEAGNERDQVLVRTLAEMARVRSLDINLSNNRHAVTRDHPDFAKEGQLRRASHDVVFGHLRHVDAPTLVSLKMTIWDHRSVPELFGEGQLPRLKSIELYGCKGPAPSLLLRASLTTLVLRSCETFWGNMDEVLSFFSASPSLEIIRLDGGYGDYPLGDNLQSVHYPAQSVNMPSLRWLQLTMELECMLPILRATKLPLTCEIDVGGRFLMIPAYYNDNFLNLVRELRDNFERHLRPSYPSHIPHPLAIHALQDGFREVTIKDYGQGSQDEGVTIIAELPYPSNNGPSSFEFGACHLPESVKEFLRIIRAILSLPGIRGAFTRLVVDKRQLLHVSWHWRYIFDYLERVEVLDLSGPPGRAFLRAYGASSESSPDVPVLPHLLKIIIRNGKVGIDVVQEALAYLTWRAERGTVQPISVSFFNCSITEDAVRLLQEHAHVSQVVWDGRTDGWEGEKGRPWWNIGFGGEIGEAYDSDGTASGYGTDETTGSGTLDP